MHYFFPPVSINFFQAPEVCLAAFIACIGMARMVYYFYEDKETGFYTNRPYKRYYTVMRPDDPKILKLRAEWYENGAPPMTSSKLA